MAEPNVTSTSSNSNPTQTPPAQTAPQGAAQTQVADKQQPSGGGKTSGNPDLGELQQRYLEAVAKHEATTFQLQQEKKKLEQELETMRKQLNRLREEPLGALQEFGVDPEKIVDSILTGGKKTVEDEVAAIREQMAQLQKMLDERTKTEEMREKEARERAFFQEQARQVQQIVESQQEYEPIKHVMALEQELFGKEPDLAALVAGPYKEAEQKFGRGLTPQEIAVQLKERASEIVERIRASSTIRKLLAENQPEKQTQQGGIDGAGATSAPPRDPSTMSREEWLQYARARLSAKQ